MGDHQGYRKIKREGKLGTSFTVQVWDPKAGKYARTKSFNSRKFKSTRDAERAADRWGKAEAGRFALGLAAAEEGCGEVKTKGMVEQYLEHMTDRGCNQTHLANLRLRLGTLYQFCPDLSADEAPRQVYVWWQVWCREPRQFGGRKGQVMPRKTDGQERSTRTKNAALGNVKAFLTWCLEARAVTGLEKPVDVDWIKPMREAQTVKPQFTLEELRRGLRLRVRKKDKDSGNYRLVIHPLRIRWALYLYLGARLREALSMRWSDIEGGFVLLRGKGRKERLVPMQRELATILRLYRRGGGDYDGWLFPDHIRRDDGGNLTRRFDAYLRAAGIEKRGRSTHSLRHCYAGLMTASGEPSALLQAYMGHSQEDMTRHYAQMATRYRGEVGDWARGQLAILASSPAFLKDHAEQ